MRVLLTEIAKQELAEARAYLDMQQAGLGKRFAREIRDAAVHIRRFPEAFPRERGEARKYLLHRFPYKLYALRGGDAIVIAVAHQHRRPDYWTDREQT